MYDGRSHFTLSDTCRMYEHRWEYELHTHSRKRVRSHEESINKRMNTSCIEQIVTQRKLIDWGSIPRTV